MSLENYKVTDNQPLNQILPIAIGVSDFRNIIANNCFYVDKTKFIEELVNDMTAVHLITRPRRFGKTLNLSMLKYFYDIEGNTENRKLFDELYISNSLAMSEHLRLCNAECY